MLCATAVVFTSLLSLAPAYAAGEEDAARVILEKSDRIRFPDEGFQADVAIRSESPGQDAETRKYRVLSRGNENTIVMTVEPAADKGQILLMKGRDLWLFMPSVSQPIRLSLAQRLTGEVANGDLARANFSGDYTPRLLRTETIGNEAMQVLELAAIDRSVTYSKVMFWVRQSDNFPIKAEFYALSGRLMKTCKYEDFKQMAGRVRPTRLVMEDALKKGEVSVLQYDAMKLRDLPEKVFNKDYLKKLE